MAKLTNGRVTVEVPDEKASRFAAAMGYKIVDDTEAEKKVEETPKPKRGRPRKAN